MFPFWAKSHDMIGFHRISECKKNQKRWPVKFFGIIPIAIKWNKPTGLVSHYCQKSCVVNCQLSQYRTLLHGSWLSTPEGQLLFRQLKILQKINIQILSPCNNLKQDGSPCTFPTQNISTSSVMLEVAFGQQIQGMRFDMFTQLSTASYQMSLAEIVYWQILQWTLLVYYDVKCTQWQMYRGWNKHI